MELAQYYTKQVSADVLLAPPRMGEIAVIEVRGSVKYALRRDAFLAKTDKVTLELGLKAGVKGQDAVSIHAMYTTIRLVDSQRRSRYRVWQTAWCIQLAVPVK